MEFEEGSAVTRIGTVHGFDKADIVDAFGYFREQVAYPCTALTVLPESPRGLQQVERFARDDFRAGERQRLAVVPFQQRLVVKRVHLRWTSVHKQENDSFGSSWEVWCLDCKRVRG